MCRMPEAKRLFEENASVVTKDVKDEICSLKLVYHKKRLASLWLKMRSHRVPIHFPAGFVHLPEEAAVPMQMRRKDYEQLSGSLPKNTRRKTVSRSSKVAEEK